MAQHNVAVKFSVWQYLWPSFRRRLLCDLIEEVRWNGREETLDLVLDETAISQAWNRLETGRADEDRGTSCSEEQTE